MAATVAAAAATSAATCQAIFIIPFSSS